MRTNQSHAAAFLFFFEHAGYGYNPATQGEIAGRVECALTLVQAEHHANESECRFGWGADYENPQEWCCYLTDEAGNVLQSLCGIDFGDGELPDGKPYKRVVEAELALEEFGS